MPAISGVGLFFFVYKGDQVIGVADAVTKVINGQSEYYLYAETDEYQKVFIPFLIYYDYIITWLGGHEYEGGRSSFEKKSSTHNAELLKKCNLRFYEKCKKMHENEGL